MAVWYSSILFLYFSFHRRYPYQSKDDEMVLGWWPHCLFGLSFLPILRRKLCLHFRSIPYVQSGREQAAEQRKQRIGLVT
jgi:hypothetical protein